MYRRDALILWQARSSRKDITKERSRLVATAAADHPSAPMLLWLLTRKDRSQNLQGNADPEYEDAENG